MEGQCELIGFQICSKIDKKEITLGKAIDDIMVFAELNEKTPEGIHLSWLTLHLALGICYQYRSTSKELVRNILKALLPFSRGIDMGLFMRDLQYYEDETPDPAILDKTMYCLHFCGGMKVILNNGLADKIFVGAARVEYKDLAVADWCYYFDLPLGHPTLEMTRNTIPDSFVGHCPLLLAVENLKKNLVLTLLKHGASPHGRPLEHLLTVLGSQEIIKEATQSEFSDVPIEIVKTCLDYCLRAVPNIKVCFDDQMIADLKKKDVYYVRQATAAFIPSDRYKTPAPLKHLARCFIRGRLLENDELPDGIEKLPNTNEDVKKYLNLQF